MATPTDPAAIAAALAAPFDAREVKFKPAAAPAKAPPADPRPAAVALRANALPADGADLLRRLKDHDARLAAQGLCRPGDLVAHVRRAGVVAGAPEDVAAWGADAIALAV